MKISELLEEKLSEDEYYDKADEVIKEIRQEFMEDICYLTNLLLVPGNGSEIDFHKKRFYENANELLKL